MAKKQTTKQDEPTATEKTQEAPAPKPKPAPEPLYAVIVNGGNDGETRISSLDELAEIAEKKLVTDGERQVQLRVTPIMVQRGFRAQRADKVPVK